MAATSPTEPPPGSGGIRVGDVGGSVNFSALGDIVGGDKITTITTTIQISVEAITQRPLIAASPYRGLDRFEDRDKDLFFGRDQLIKSLLAQLSASNVLLVLGASGSGKSSVVRAGLLPQLSQLIGARFRYFTFVPDVNPFESLRSALQGAGFSQTQTRELTESRPETPAKLIHALRREGDQWLVFVDQFEEIFTVADERLRASFIAALVQIAQDPTSSTKLVLAMRADFLDRFSPFPHFAKIVEKNIDFVADMHADELRQAIEQPAARHGVVFEQGLVEEIIRDVQGQAGSLPLLQYTLNLLWQEEARENGLTDRHLNTRAYRELGGVRGALQKRADEIYASFGDGIDAHTATPSQEIVRQIFLRLVDLAGEGSNDAAWRPVRRRASMAMFTAAPEQEILQALINQKLLVSNREGDDATVEVAHEALFSSWGRLKNWIEAGKQVIFARNRMADDARRWQRRRQESDRSADEELLSGSRLAQALDMRARGDFVTVVGGLSDTENLFLDRSASVREKRARLRRQLEVTGVALLLVSIAGAVFGWIGQRNAAAQAGRAALSAKQAQVAERTAQAEAQKSRLALSRSDFLRATDLLAEKKTFEAVAFLARACRTDPENSNAAARLFSLLRQRNWVLPVTEPVGADEKERVAAIEHVSFHPDGTKFVATTFYEAKARVWETATGRLLLGPVACNTGGFEYESRPPLPDERSFNAREPWILVAQEKQVQIGDLATGKVRSPILEHKANVTVAQFSPDGTLVQTGDVTGKIITWNAHDGTKRTEVQLPGPVLALSRDGGRALAARASDESAESATDSDEFQVWNLAGGGKPSPLPVKIRGKFLTMREDGQQVCTWSYREGELSEIQFWDVATGVARTVKLKNVPADTEFINRARFMPGSRLMVTAAIRRSESDSTGEAQFGTGRVRVWDTVNGEQLSVISHETLPSNPMEGFQPYRASLSPEATRVASVASEDRVLRISAARGGASLNESPSSSEQFSDVTFHPDGTRILTASFSGHAQIWDIRPTTPIDDPIRIHPDKMTEFTVRFSRDGENVLLKPETGEPRCFDAKTGQVITPVPAEFATPDPALADSTGQRVFRTVDREGETEEELLPRQLFDVAANAPVTPAVTIGSNDRVRFSLDGKHLLIIAISNTDSPFLTIRNAKTGALMLQPINSVSDAWFNPKGDCVLISAARGLVVMDLGTGRELIDPLPLHRVLGAAFTPEGLVALVADDSGLALRRFNFQLGRAPALLPDLAEIIAQHALNESGIPDAFSTRISEFGKLQTRPEEPSTSPIFLAWMKWFFAPRDMRPIAPESKTTMAEYLQRCIERGTPESLGEAELLAVGNKEFQAKIAAKRGGR